MAIAGASKIQKFSNYLTNSTDAQKLERMSEFWTTGSGDRSGEVQEAIALVTQNPNQA